MLWIIALLALQWGMEQLMKQELQKTDVLRTVEMNFDLYYLLLQKETGFYAIDFLKIPLRLPVSCASAFLVFRAV